MIQASVILDSIGPTAAYSRLHTQLWKYPKFVHQESLRHRKLIFTDWQERDFSFSVSSARAIPFSKMFEEARSDELRASPEFWGTEQKGMSPGGELNNYDKKRAMAIWREAAMDASFRAEQLAEIGVHKSIVNRIIEPFIHVNCLVTGTIDGWMNFFGLRLDGAADPILRALAEASWKIWNKSQPQILEPGDWHLPFISQDGEDQLTCARSELYPECSLEILLTKISVARCARLSYLSFETNKRSTIEEDLKLYDRLVGAVPIHASPAEHQATPDIYFYPVNPINPKVGWENEKQSGNLGPGWRQYRKMLKNEAIAPLPGSIPGTRFSRHTPEQGLSQ